MNTTGGVPFHRRRLLPRELTNLRWVWSLGGLSVPELGRRVFIELRDKDTLGRTAEISYYFLLALFPFLICLSSLVGLLFQRQDLYNRVISYLSTVMPETAFEVVRGTVNDITASAGRTSLSFGLIAALWTASLGMDALIKGLNLAYNVREFRVWWKRRLVAIALTIVVLILMQTALWLFLAGEQIGSLLAWLIPSGWFEPAWDIARWVLAILFVLVSLSVIYLAGPNLKEQRWQAILPGAIVAFILWVMASAGFRLYLAHFDSYSKTYGSLGAVIVLLLWFYLTGAAILIGGEVNAEIRKAAAAAGSPEARRISEASE